VRREDFFYTCPICGWTGLPDDPEERVETICACCDTQFGALIFGDDYPELRQKWFDSGMPFTYLDEIPDHWDPVAQLRAAGLPTP
jgi:hypothetical protein